MPPRTVLNLGSAPQCELPVTGRGVAPRHAQLAWRDGLWLQDLGQGRTTVDGRVLAANEAVQLPGFHCVVLLGEAQVSLTSPEISKLFLDRSSVPAERAGVVNVGRDPSRAQIVVAHPTVSGMHLRVDVTTRTVTDLGSKSGTFDRASQRLPANQPVPMDLAGGYSLGAVWIPTTVLMELAGAPVGAPGAAHGPMQSTDQFGPASMVPQAPQMLAAQAVSPAARSMAGGGPSGPRPTAVPEPAPQRTMFGSFNLADGSGGRAIAIIGRLPACDIVLPYPQVSGRHSSVMRSPDGSLLVSDLGSTNGTYVNGQRLVPGTQVPVRPGTKIFVGPYPVVVDLQGQSISAYVEQEHSEWSGNLVEIEALDLFLKVPDRENKSQDKILLNHVTFKARPGDLIALMGPSGAGKTTLLTVLNGYLRPTTGEVRVNGENLYAIYDALRGSIGYVPQDDIVHPELTVREAIKYSAQFRLPSDYSAEEIDRRVEQTIKDLGLEQVQNLEIGKPEKKVLSGGQRKRVNIALELVTDPALMFLDEPTSGLAADDTVALINLLSDLAKKTGKTIIVTIHQPAREEYEKFNLAFIMGFGGEPLYFGPTGKDSYDFFGRYVAHKGQSIDNPRDMFDLLKLREEEFVSTGRYPNKASARLAAAQEWRKEFYRQDNPVYQKMYSGVRQPGKPGQSRPQSRASVPLIRQFSLLLTRYAIVKRRDTAGTVIMLAQAPIIGVLLAAVFSSPPAQPNLWCQNAVMTLEAAVAQAAGHTCELPATRFGPVKDFSGALFFLAVASIWFGTSNAAREIVSEQAIYRRERMVNLSIFNYMMSKFVLLSLLCVVQCTVLLGIAYPSLGLGGGDFGAFPWMLGTMVATAMCSASVGLFLSTVVTSSEAAMALTPIALIPQVVLGGLLVPMTNKSWLQYVMAGIPSRWSFEGMIGAERYALNPSWRIQTCAISGPGVHNGLFDCAVEQIARTTRHSGGWGFATYDQPWMAIGVMSGMALTLLILVSVLLRRRDSV